MAGRLKVKVQYGVLTGEGSGRQVRKALRAAGYDVTRIADEADIIIGHSAGCFWLPDTGGRQRYMLIDPPYWPGRSIRERAISRTKHHLTFWQSEYRFRSWLTRNGWITYYFVTQFRRQLRISRHAKVYNLADILEDRTVLLVRNHDDDWLTPQLDYLRPAAGKLIIEHMPGDHEHFLHYPEPYVALLQLLHET